MKNKFTNTITIYNRYSAQFVQHFEKKLDTTELDKFLGLLPKNANILDAGCGSARDAAYFISKGYTALGIDISDGLLAEAKKTHPEVPTQQMSLTELTFPNETFDGIWCKAALLHIERSDIPKVLQSFFNMLKKDGVLFIQTKAGEGEGEQKVPFDQSLSRYFTFFGLTEMKDLIEQAGFSVLEEYDFNGKQRYMISRDQEWIVLLAKKK